ncbi:acyltransferase [Arthrobacter sp. B10-11]|uniref:acyltransferase n=1 Tax=Arthrobacter sp. B10-11 TaxID=3081160 RepID=UPI002954ADBA|nr:acyltransferase [Arthrobacter sp. B10-11]MDV8146987.1 acyltransferase [Arthrobacter sp. B10-11]
MREKLSHIKYWGLLWLATLLGNVPSHALRNAFYRRGLGIRLPQSSIIYWRARFFGLKGISIGESSIVGDHAFLDGRNGIHIGSNVNIASEVRIWTAEHDVFADDFGQIGGPVVINDYAFIGSRVTILPGVTIGEGAVIGAGAVVTKDIAAWTIAFGIPAKSVKARPRVQYTLQTTKKALFQ